MYLKTVYLLTLLLFTCYARKRDSLELVAQWKELDFTFPTYNDRVKAISNGLFVEGNAVPIDVDACYGMNAIPKIFVSIPRFTTGIPYTLATITNLQGPNGPQLQAYPNYNWHSSHGMNCAGITSVFRVHVDPCKRLWVVDTGRIGTIQYCPPQILVFDIPTDTLLHRYQFPQSQYKTGVSLFITPIVDVRDPPPTGRCLNVKVYIADVTGFGILVYDLAKNFSWRVENKLTYPNPDYGTFTIAGESFDLMDGILGMSVTPIGRSGERYLYFHALASITENAVPLSILDNSTIWLENSEAMPRSFRELGFRNSQSAAEAMDSKGNLFFGLMDPIAIVKWNIDTPYRLENIKIVAQNDDTLQFASGMKIIKNQNRQEELWVLTCRFQKIMAGTKSSNEINFRIQRCLTDNLLNNRPCNSAVSTRDNLIFT